MLKKLMLSTAVGGLMIGAAVAQMAPTPADRPTPPAATTPAPAPSATSTTTAPARSAQVVNTQRADQWLASNFRGTDVLGSDNEKIGDVSDILFDKTGKIEAFVVSVGGFLGMGAKDVAMAPSAFEVVTGDKSKSEADKLKVSMNKDQLKQAATFEPYKETRTTTGSGATTPSRPAPAAPASR